jgi:hypothetical protein
MIFFKKKKETETAAPATAPKKPKSLQEVGQTRVLTAEGWRRRALKQKKPSKKAT